MNSRIEQPADAGGRPTPKWYDQIDFDSIVAWACVGAVVLFFAGMLT